MRLYIMLLFVFMASFAAAQDLSQVATLEDLKKASAKPTLRSPRQPEIEHAVNEAEYVVGPGDMFSIIIGGQSDEQQQLMVSPEGNLVFPAAGSLKVDGMLLCDVKQRIREKLNTRYRADNIQVSLIQLRSFRVAVTGAVHSPGLFAVNGMNRVSDAILAAGGLLELPSPLPEPEKTRVTSRTQSRQQADQQVSEEEYKILENNIASKRNIIVKRLDGSVLHADMLKFERNGDLHANPYLADGDVIVVSTVKKDIGQVSILGAVKSPAAFEFLKGDKIRDLLEMAHGFTVDADSENIILVRFVENSSRARQVRNEIDWSKPEQVDKVLDINLQPDDRIFVRSMPKFHKQRTVEIKGEVLYPGKYALLENASSLTGIIKLAGGFTKEAALHSAYVVRRSYEDRKDPDFERLELMAVQEMERKEKVYFRERAREIKGLVSTDFEALFEKGEEQYDVKLADQDLIVVPAKEYAVNVVGHVKNPGLVPYVPGKNAKYYIERAGGYNVGAWKKRVRVKKAGSGEMLSTKGAVVEMGDMVFVPEKIESENIIRDIALITVQMITVVMLVVQTSWYANRP